MKKLPILAVFFILLGSFSIASAQTVGSYTFFDSEWGGLDVDGAAVSFAGPCFGTATFGCADARSLGYVAGTVLSYQPHNISGPASFNASNNNVGGGVADCVYGVGGGCPTDLAVFASTAANGTYYAIGGISTNGGGAQPWYVFFTVTSGLASVNGGPAPVPDFTHIQFPLVFATSSAGIATSSALWSDLSVASTTLAASCDSSDFLSDAVCNVASFLFLPNPNILQAYAGLPVAVQGKFPFSWVYGVQQDIGVLTASSTSNFTSYDINLAGLGIGSTTPMGNLLPNFDAFSSSTVMKFIPQSVWDTGQLLIAGALWLGMFYFLFHDARRRFHRA